MKDILQNKLKQFIIIFGKILGVILVIILMTVFAVIPCTVTGKMEHGFKIIKKKEED